MHSGRGNVRVRRNERGLATSLAVTEGCGSSSLLMESSTDTVIIILIVIIMLLVNETLSIYLYI